jgi:hypothetical protein
MIPTYYDRERVARILGVDGKPKAVKINPELPQASARTDVLEINPAIGAYDVRVKTGPSYTSLRQEMQDRLVEISQGNPQLGAALAPLLLQQSDTPGADRAAKVALALLPPPVQAAYDEEDGQPEIPPQLMAEVQGMQQQMQEMEQALGAASERVRELESGQAMEFNKLLIDAFGKETDRLKVLGEQMPPEAIQALVIQTLQQVLTSPDPTPQAPPGVFPNPQEQAPPGAFFMEQPPEMAATGANPGPGPVPVLPEGM